MPPKKQAVTAPEAPLEAHYDRLVSEGQVRDDVAQRKVLAILQALREQLAGKKRSLFKKSTLRGLYIWGNVGRGKSMLMDLFYQHVPMGKKRRIHFHAFMQEVHTRIHALRKTGDTDPVMVLAAQLAEETSLLCFDELQATDVADATLLYRLFSGLLDAGVVIVSTSNHPPKTLYTGAHQRERFDKFIALIEKHMQVAALSSPKDYRQQQSKSLQQVFFTPLGPKADTFVEESLKRLGAGDAKQEMLSVHGRQYHFTMYGKTIGRFSFHELCETAMGPADYLALAKRVKTLILTDIPKLSIDKRNEAKRFVTLIDALYENKIVLIATAAAAPDQLYAEGDGAFEFKRTVSRLVEMQSDKWINR